MAARFGLAFSLALLVPIAGCLGGTDGPASSSSTAPSTYQTVVGKAGEPAEPQFTDLLHLMDGRRLTTIEPDSFEPVRIPVASVANVGQVATQDASTLWNFTWPADVGAIRGEIVLVVDVQGIVVNSPFTGLTGGKGCFWAVSISVLNPQSAPGDTGPASGGGSYPCIEEPQVVPEGTRVLRIPFDLPAANYASGFRGTVQLVAQAYAESPDARVDLLTGSITQDSTVSFEGVGWPVGLEQVTLLT